MRVRFYTGGFTHTFYREQVRATPEGVTLVGSSPELYATGMKSDIAASAKWTYRASRLVKRCALRGLVRIGTPNVRYLRSAGCDLIHSAQYPLLGSTPWVVDFEDASVFAWYDPDNLRRPQVRWCLEHLFGRDCCRWLLPWSEAAADSLRNALDCSGFASKIRTVPPAIRPATRAVPREDEIVRLLFIGTAFHYKGGVETLRAFKRLQPRLPVRLTVVSYVPPDVKREFATVPGLTFGSRLPPSELEALFQVSDLLVAPFHSDTYGFVLLEAFAHGIPCIVTNQFAMPEIVRDGVTGLVVDNHLSRFGSDRLPRMSPFDDDSAVRARLADPPDWYVDQLTSAIETLVTSRATRLAMSEAAFQEVTYGRFSVDRRRRAMAEVYGP